jgi:hypothetical protein
MMAANENASDDYKDTNVYLHDGDIEDEPPNWEDSEANQYDRLEFVELKSWRPDSILEVFVGKKTGKYNEENLKIHKLLGFWELTLQPLHREYIEDCKNSEYAESLFDVNISEV